MQIASPSTTGTTCHPEDGVSDLRHAIRALRKASGIRLDDLSGSVGISKQTTCNLEYGKDTV